MQRRMEWSVLVEAAGQPSLDAAQAEHVADELVEILEAGGPAVTIGTETVGALFSVDARSASDAVESATAQFERAMDGVGVGLGEWDIFAVEAVTATELTRRLALD